MTPVVYSYPKRALVLDLAELEVIERALIDLDISSWGGVEALPGFHTALAKIKDALAVCDLEMRRRRLARA